MILTVQPASRLRGFVKFPASKSYSIRAFMIAACGGQSTIYFPSDCDDSKVSIRVARCLGACVTRLPQNVWKIKAHQRCPRLSRINVGESGTVLRFLLPILASYSKPSRVIGEGTLRGRPNNHLVNTLRDMGAFIQGRGPKETVPIDVRGENFHGGKFLIDGSLSSQFISALLIACPCLEQDSLVTISGEKIVSQPYIHMTLKVLKEAGIQVKLLKTRQFAIQGRQTFHGLKNFKVPSDYGLSAFLFAAAVLIKSSVIFDGYFDPAFIQADGAILPLLEKMGARMTRKRNCFRVQGPISLKGGDFSLKDSPDLVPIMAILALFAKGRTRLYDIGHVRVKESDRISDLCHELKKVGAKVIEKKDEIVIIPQVEYRSHVMLDPHHDHRLAMAFIVLGLKLGIRIKDIDCINKSYPKFIKDIQSLGAEVFKN